MIVIGVRKCVVRVVLVGDVYLLVFEIDMFFVRVIVVLFVVVFSLCVFF